MMCANEPTLLAMGALTVTILWIIESYLLSAITDHVDYILPFFSSFCAFAPESSLCHLFGSLGPVLHLLGCWLWCDILQLELNELVIVSRWPFVILVIMRILVSARSLTMSLLFCITMIDDDRIHSKLAGKCFELTEYILITELILCKTLRKSRWFIVSRTWLLVQTITGAILFRRYNDKSNMVFKGNNYFHNFPQDGAYFEINVCSTGEWMIVSGVFIHTAFQIFEMRHFTLVWPQVYRKTKSDPYHLSVHDSSRGLCAV
ncbi:hypothetical protein D915_002827 [Fasciola hepatica]|uniref:Uncharacterized protein n=1 Tax=Fasciola hepatica TaxID=6192 RepID=A0A4E0RCR4_FASHE|nr:hypothetical protein D915_002827 [Fasciola hepatica]